MTPITRAIMMMQSVFWRQTRGNEGSKMYKRIFLYRLIHDNTSKWISTIGFRSTIFFLLFLFFCFDCLCPFLGFWPRQDTNSSFLSKGRVAILRERKKNIVHLVSFERRGSRIDRDIVNITRLNDCVSGKELFVIEFLNKIKLRKLYFTIKSESDDTQV